MLKVIRAAITRKRIEKACGRLATDWLLREYAPTFLRLAGLNIQAETLEKLPALTSTRRMKAALPILNRIERSIAESDVVNDALSDAMSGVEAFPASVKTQFDLVRATEEAVGRDAALLWVPPTVFDETESITHAAVLAATILATEPALASTVKASRASQELLLERMSNSIAAGARRSSGWPTSGIRAVRRNRPQTSTRTDDEAD
jgi:hypothetical protein